MNIVIKIGTQGMLSEDSAPTESLMLQLVEQIAAL